MQQKIAIQGFPGSFHHMAANEYFGPGIEPVCFESFPGLIRAMTTDPTIDAAIMAIENSIAGTILPNYKLLHHSGLQVTGEIYLQIRQHLLALKDVELKDINQVMSHPMAILQCMEYLQTTNWKIIETSDTAGSARDIFEMQVRNAAAIAGSFAAEVYGMNILATDIHTEKDNYTRFLVLERQPVSNTGANKVTLSFCTSHQRGSLAAVLTLLAEAGLNLTKLQSFPITGKPFRYRFHTDMEFSAPGDWDKILPQLTSMVSELEIYGLYKSATFQLK